MQAQAVILNAPQDLEVASLPLAEPGPADILVRTRWSGISTGTERLLYTGRMPHFPGLGYPLVPGYESVGIVESAGSGSGVAEGATVFVPGTTCWLGVRSLFGATGSHLVVPGARAVPVAASLGPRAILLALAATARHALCPPNQLPGLIVGHGVLGRLLARLTILQGGAPPTVWEHNQVRRTGAASYPVVAPDDDDRRDYEVIFDVSGDADILDNLVSRLAPGGELVLAGFYADRLSFAFPPAFMREARIRVAAQWTPRDMDAVRDLVGVGALDLDGLLTHTAPAQDAETAYRTAFNDAECLKMVLDWSGTA